MGESDDAVVSDKVVVVGLSIGVVVGVSVVVVVGFSAGVVVGVSD